MVSDARWRQLLVGGALATGTLTWYLCTRRVRQHEEEERDPADFGAFLKKRGPAPPKHLRDPANFGAFLKSTYSDAAAPATVQQAPPPAPTGPRADQAVVTVMYGTEYGFAKEIAELLCDKLRTEQGGAVWPRLINMASTPTYDALAQQQMVLMVCSTQGDGVPPSEARSFCDWLQSPQAPTLTGIPFSVCALGDRSYQHYCRCGKQLDARLEALGGQRVVARQDVDREDWTAINTWLDAVLAAVKSAGLQAVGEAGAEAAAAEAATAVEAPAGFSKSRPYWARVVAIEGLCSVSGQDDKNTFRMEFDLGDSGLTYIPGDALGIYPSNCPQAVDELLQVLGLAGAEAVACPGWHYADVEGTTPQQLTLREVLTHCYDLRCPKPDILTAFPAQLHKAMQAVNKENMVNGDHAAVNGHTNGATSPRTKHLDIAALASDSAALQAYLEPRHLVDVLIDLLHHPTPTPLPEACLPALLACLRPLAPRLYSISSSPLEDARRVQATIALVRYALGGRDRIGVASTFCGERLSVGDRVPVFITTNPDFRLPTSRQTPIIMVGPGTGLAPFRAFVLQRTLEAAKEGPAAEGAPGPAVLYFGCRRRDQDFLYGALLEQWHAEGTITLHTAFSREQGHKVYVQQRLRETAAEVWSLLQEGAHFYVCGDAGSMAVSVEEALLALIAEHGQRDEAGAQAYLEELRVAGRYQRDIW